MSTQNNKEQANSANTNQQKTGLPTAFVSLGKDLWVVILDVIAVNLAYLLALLIRFYVNNQFRPTVSYYLTDFAKFAPFYTVLCIIVFTCLKFYNGMWRYAGINDTNRIIVASGITCVIQIVGTALFVRRMPITYYVIGGLLQYVFISIIRFAYRFIIVEHRKITKLGHKRPIAW